MSRGVSDISINTLSPFIPLICFKSKKRKHYNGVDCGGIEIFRTRVHIVQIFHFLNNDSFYIIIVIMETTNTVDIQA